MELVKTPQKMLKTAENVEMCVKPPQLFVAVEHVSTPVRPQHLIFVPAVVQTSRKIALTVGNVEHNAKMANPVKIANVFVSMVKQTVVGLARTCKMTSQTVESAAPNAKQVRSV